MNLSTTSLSAKVIYNVYRPFTVPLNLLRNVSTPLFATYLGLLKYRAKAQEK